MSERGIGFPPAGSRVRTVDGCAPRAGRGERSEVSA